MTTYLETRGPARPAPRRGRRRSAPSAHASTAPARAARRASTSSRAQARRIGYVRPGEQLFIVKGTAAWRRSARRADTGRVGYRQGHGRSRRRRASARSRAARVPPRRRRAARSGLPAVTEQEPYGRGRRAVPDDVLPHVPASRRRRLAPRGGRRRRALERRRRERRRAARRPRARDRGAARIRRELAAGDVGTDGGAVARARHRRLAQPEPRSSASTPTSPSRWRAPATSSARRSSTRCPSRWPPMRCCEPR